MARDGVDVLLLGEEAHALTATHAAPRSLSDSRPSAPGAVVAPLRPGVLTRELRGVCAAAFASQGTTTPAFEAVAAPLDAGATTWLSPDRALADGERVVVRVGALRDGWEASVARTYVIGAPAREQPAPAGWTELVGSCVPGATVGELRRRGAIVHGAGRGVEPWADDMVLAPGLMAAI